MSEIRPLECVSEIEQERCRAKVRYSTKKIALSVKNQILRGHRGHRRAADLRTYCCPACHGWHLTKDVDSPKSGNGRALTLRFLMHRLQVRQRRELFAARHPFDDFAPHSFVSWAEP